jgi:ribosomal protein S13
MLNFSHYSINKKKKVFYSLQNIFGLGKQSSLNICKKLNINPKIK